jgi:hypothetical protein
VRRDLGVQLLQFFSGKRPHKQGQQDQIQEQSAKIEKV